MLYVNENIQPPVDIKKPLNYKNKVKVVLTTIVEHYGFTLNQSTDTIQNLRHEEY